MSEQMQFGEIRTIRSWKVEQKRQAAQRMQITPPTSSAAVCLVRAPAFYLPPTLPLNFSPFLPFYDHFSIGTLEARKSSESTVVPMGLPLLHHFSDLLKGAKDAKYSE